MLAETQLKLKESETWKEQAIEATAQLSNLGEELAAVSADRDRIKVIFGQVEAELASLRADSAWQRAEIARLREQVLKAAEAMADVERAQSADKTSIRGELAEARKQLANANANLESMRAGRDALAERDKSADAQSLDAMKKELADSFERLNDSERQIAGLKAKLALTRVERDEGRS